MNNERIPFAEAITEPLLLKAGFDSLSVPQQAVLKIIYGLPLEEKERWVWDCFNGGGVYDELGYVIDVNPCGLPYAPREYEDITLVVGRRSGKTSSIQCFSAIYEALLGGHKEHVAEKQMPLTLVVAQDLSTAKANLRQFMLHWLEKSPIGKKELGNVTQTVTADSIRLKRGLITVGPPTIKLRSQAIAVCAMDELAFWPKDKEAAAPDFEIERAVRPAMMQFPFRKLIKATTPWTEEGLAWQALQTGTWGRFLDSPEARAASDKVLVLRGPTGAFQNPKAQRSYLQQERAKDPEAFKREYLAEPSKSVSGFLSVNMLRAATDKGVVMRSPQPGRLYVATMDPAYKHDAFAFCIGHLEGGNFLLDFIESWRGTKENPLSPTHALETIGAVCKNYGIRIVVSDQYHDVTLMDLAFSKGLIIDPNPLTNELKQKMWGGLQAMLNMGKLRLLDKPDLLEELAKLEKRLTPSGYVQYGGTSDDLATVVALCAHRCGLLGEQKPLVQDKAVPLSTEVRRRILNRQGAAQPWWA